MSTQPPTNLSQVASTLGTPFIGGSNRPIRLDDPGTAWFVESGALDIFVAESHDGAADSSLKHVLRAGPGRLVFGIARNAAHSLIAVAKGLPNSTLRSLPLDALLEAVLAGALIDQVDQWIMDLTAAVHRDITLYRHPNAKLHPGTTLDLDAGSVLASRHGVVWAATQSLSSTFLDTEEPDQVGTGWLPLTPKSWLTVMNPAHVAGADSETLHQKSLLFPSLAQYHHLLLRAERTNRLLLLVDVANQDVARADSRRHDEAQAREALYSALLARTDATDPGQTSALEAAVAVIGRHEGLTFRMPPAPADGRSRAAPSLQAILHASGVRCRSVKLAPEDRWWIGDSGAMLGFRKSDRGAMALIPGETGRYRIIDPGTGQSEPANATTAQALDGHAWMFYRPLPDNHPIGPQNLLRFVARGLVGGLWRFVTAGFLGGLLTLAPAVVVGLVTGEIIPSGSLSSLISTITAMIAAALIGALLQMLQGTTLMRIEGRAITWASASLWDRLLGLPQAFFRRFTAGDLAVRVLTFQSLRDLISGMVANTALSIVFLLPAFSMIFLYDLVLGWVSFVIGVLGAAATITFGLLQTNPQRRVHEASRRLIGDLLAFINGIHKLRLTRAEGAATAAWARRYREQKKGELEIGRLNDHLVAASAAIPVLAGGTIIGVAWSRGFGGIETGDFLAVFAASMIFYEAVVRLGQSFEAVAMIIPGYEQIKPILEAVPETSPAGSLSSELRGEVHFDHVSFSYSQRSPLVLDDVSIHVNPGEFVAIVGESGAGKTTLLQLALGLEEPVIGAVQYDGRNLAHLNRRAVRQQIGVVMQDGVLLPGNILDNITGSLGDLTAEDAWRAAHLAAVDDEIAAMPMQMYTLVGDSDAMFSGGQAQRIRIAAALARHPRIVFLDEATNWLDTDNQARVMRGIENLSATRIVIAHRLSTIRKADRIYVLDGGKVVQQGGFDELFKAEGLFRSLMLRQTV